MKLIFIYGPPAVGKLTVAKSLSRLTNYKIFHNHLTFDLVSSLFEFGSKSFFDLNDKLRIEMFERAAKDNVGGLIFTFCYVHPYSINFLKAVKKRVEKHNGQICYVQLYCENSKLFERVKEISRKKYGKINTKKQLNTALDERDFFTPVPFVNNLKIDNTNISAKEVARKIKDYYKLWLYILFC